MSAIRGVRIAALLLCAAGCIGSSPEPCDGGVPVNPDADASFDWDAGADGGIDSGFDYSFGICRDAGEVLERQSDTSCGCTNGMTCGIGDQCDYECVECNDKTPCPGNGICMFIFPGICIGSCTYPADSCGSGPMPTSVVYQSSWFACTDRRDVFECDWVRALDLSSARLRLSVQLHLSDGGLEIVDAGSVSAEGFDGIWRSAAENGLWCVTTKELQSESCVSHGLYEHVDISSGDAGHSFEYGSINGRQPPLPVLDAVYRLGEVSSPYFRDAGFPIGPW